MKKIITLIAVLLINTIAFAQVPQKMSYQAVIRNTSDALVTSTAVGMQISILQGSSTGSAVYVETHTPTTNANGLVSVEIGSGSVVSGNFSTIDWSTGNYYIKSETDVTGGTNYTISGTSQLLSVPYAMYAGKTEGTLENGTNAGNTPYWNGTSWVTNSNAIYNNGGNIGIGTTTPTTAKLVINTPAGQRGLDLATADSYANLRVIQNSTSAIDKDLYLGYNSGATSSLHLYSNNIESMTVKNNNVGIGNNNPTAKLDVAGTIKIADGSQGAGKVLTSDANGLGTWAAPANTAPYYNLFSTWDGTNPQASAPFTLGNSGTMVTFAIFNNCAQGQLFGGTMIINPAGEITIINYSNVLASATMSATGNVITLDSGCGAITMTFNVTGSSCTITTGGVPQANTQTKMTVLAF